MSAAIQLKLRGLAKASSAHRDSLLAARLLATFIGGKQETVTADDIFAYFAPAALGMASGALFRDEHWQFSGWVESQRESNRGRFLRSWRLK